MEGVFVIKERPDLGGFLPRGGALEFRWDAAHRNIPVQPWTFGVQQRTVRTDYPGADSPTEQVLGPNYTPFTLTGRWSDKFNPLTDRQPNQTNSQFGRAAGGYAVQTMRSFEAMVRRGNLIEITFQSLSIIGLITECSFDYRRAWDIGYSFTFSPHRRPGNNELDKKVSPRTVKDPSTLGKELADKIKNSLQSVQDSAPAFLSAESLAIDMGGDLDSLTLAVDDYLAVVDQRVLVINVDAGLSLRRAVNAADLIIGRAADLKNRTQPLKADVNLMYETPIGTLSFETWVRSTGSQSRLVVYNGYQARTQLDEQVEPTAMALYKPYKGESLYSISNRFYGTPHNWRLIKARNRLPSSQLNGNEILVIPEAPAQ